MPSRSVKQVLLTAADRSTGQGSGLYPPEDTIVSTTTNQLDDFSGLGVAFQLLLGEEQSTVHHHFEHAPRRLQQLDVGVWESATQLGRQTGGPGLVVSNDAVFDRHAHL